MLFADPAAPPAQQRAARLAWATLLVNFFVIAWGAFVRASGSGAGCGDHWPMCNGELVPRAPAVETLIELTHRLTSGVVLLMTLATLILCWRAWPAGHRVRRAALVTMGFMLAEAGVGAAIVLLKKVGQDDSIGRAVIMAVHLGNTFLLLASNLIAARWATGAPAVRLRGQGAPLVLLAVNLGLLLVLGASGAVTALGDTLFPAGSLAEGIAQDLSPTAHVLIRLRVFHPLGAVLVGGFTAVVAVAVGFGRGAAARRSALVVLGLFLTQITVGVVNLALLAPIWAQLVHLLLADAVWLSVVWLGMAALQPGPASSTQTAPKITTAT
jgi:heme A synthase